MNVKWQASYFYMYTLRTTRPWEYWYAGLKKGGSVVENISLSSRVQLAGKKGNNSKQTVQTQQTLSSELSGEIIWPLSPWFHSVTFTKAEFTRNKHADILAVNLVLVEMNL